MSQHPKFCSSCGAALFEGQKFCAQCGTKIEIISVVEEVKPTEAPFTPPTPPTPPTPQTPAIPPIPPVPTVEPHTPGMPDIPNIPQTPTTDKRYTPDYLPIAQIVKRFPTAVEAAEFASTLAAEWYLSFGILAEVDRLRQFASEVDKEYHTADDRQSYYVVDDNGSIGLTNDNGFRINWFARAIVRVVSSPVGRPAETPQEVVTDEVKQKVNGLKSLFNLKTLPKKILIAAAVLAVVWIGAVLLKRFFPGAGNSIVMKVVNYLTFATGGLSKNILFQIGGFFGKMLVSATLLTIVLGGFKLIPKGVATLRHAFSSMSTTDSKSAKAMMLCGIGSAMMLYNFFTGNGRLALSMVGFAGTLSMIWAMGGGVNFIRRMVVAFTATRSEYGGDVRFENIPRTMQVLAGMAVGFILSIIISLIITGYTLYFLGEALIIVSFVMLTIKTSTKKVVGAAMVVGMLLCAPHVYAAAFDIDSEPVWETNNPNLFYRVNEMTPSQVEAIFKHIPELPRESNMAMVIVESDGRTYEAFYDAYRRAANNSDDVDEYVDGPMTSIHFCAGAAGASSSTSANVGTTETVTNAVGSFVAILLVLLGPWGGATTPGPSNMPPIPGAVPPISDTWVKFDKDGDIEYTDPGTGKKSIWVHQDDGRYRKAGEGSVATEEELRQWAEHASDNKEYYEHISHQHEEAVREQHERLQQEIEEKNRQNELERLHRAEEETKKLAREDYINNLKDRYQVITDEELRKAIVDEQVKNGVSYDKAMEKAKWLDVAVKTCEVTKSVTDVAIDVLADYTGPAGKAISVAYTYSTEMLGGISEAYATGGDMGKAAAAGFSKASLTMVENAMGEIDNQLVKYATNSLCEGIKNGIDSLNNGKTPAEVFKDYIDGTATGLKDTYIDSVTSGMAEIVKSDDAAKIAKLMSEHKIPAKHVDALAKIFSAIGKAAT